MGSAAGHPVQFTLFQDVGHSYQPRCEVETCDFLLASVLPGILPEFWSIAASIRKGSSEDNKHLTALNKLLLKEPSLVPELCTTGILGVLLQSLPRATGELASNILAMLLCLSSAQTIESTYHPRLRHHLCRLMETNSINDATLDAAAE